MPAGTFPARHGFSFAAGRQRGHVMRAIISGVAAAIVLGILAAVILSAVQEPAYKAYSTSSTRLDEPGTNLVGKDWTGNPKDQRDES